MSISIYVWIALVRAVQERDTDLRVALTITSDGATSPNSSAAKPVTPAAPPAEVVTDTKSPDLSEEELRKIRNLIHTAAPVEDLLGAQAESNVTVYAPNLRIDKSSTNATAQKKVQDAIEDLKVIMEAILIMSVAALRWIYMAFPEAFFEASAGARAAFLGFPLLVFFTHRTRFSKRFCARRKDYDHEDKEKEIQPSKNVSLFTMIGSALAHSTGEEGAETVSRCRDEGLSYAHGPAVSSGKWRCELSPETEFNTVLVGIIAEGEAPMEAALEGSWAFVGATHGSGFAYLPSGRAVRRGCEIDCIATDERVIEATLDAPKRLFELRTSEGKLLCTFEGIRNCNYHFALAVLDGALTVQDASACKPPVHVNTE